MARFQPLGNGIHCVDALYVKPGVASIYLLVEAGEVAIIETGTRHSLDNVLATLEALGIASEQVRYVIPTHVHLDHAGGAGAMMRQFAAAELLIHPRGAAHMIDPQRLVAGTVGVYGQAAFDRLYGEILPVDESRVQIVEDHQTASLGSRELVFIDTPGHARHHFCIYDARSGGVFSGDSFGICYAPMKALARGLLPTTPPTQFDPPALHATVDRIMRFEPRCLYLTHYGEHADPAGQLDSFHRWIDTYVDLTEQVAPRDEAATAQLQSELTRTVLGALSDSAEPLTDILELDLRLNAQGLAWWWQRKRHE